MSASVGLGLNVPVDGVWLVVADGRWDRVGVTGLVSVIDDQLGVPGVSVGVRVGGVRVSVGVAVLEGSDAVRD